MNLEGGETFDGNKPSPGRTLKQDFIINLICAVEDISIPYTQNTRQTYNWIHNHERTTDSINLSNYYFKYGKKYRNVYQYNRYLFTIEYFRNGNYRFFKK